MKETILRVLEKYKGTQANLDSEALREMITDELLDELHSKYIITEDLRNMSGTGRENHGEWLRNEEFDG